MSEVSVDDVAGLEMDGSKRETKLTAKAFANKIESLQREQKKDVNTINPLRIYRDAGVLS